MELASDPRLRPARVLIADDEPLFIDSVQSLLAGDDRVEIVGTATNGQDAVELAVALDPDVTLLDISMTMLDGIEASADVDRARQAGVAAFLTKDRIGTQLVEAILEVAER